MEENDGNIDWVCRNCPKKRAGDLHQYTVKLLQLRTLQQAGYPLDADDLSYDEWLDLGRVNEILKRP